MAIPIRILNLVETALKDATLTPREKGIIMDEAQKEGVASAEMEEYLQKAITFSISQKPKNQLKACPCCGAQIPLISEYCPYCAHHYEDIHNGESSDIDDHLQKAIENENKKTAQEADAKLDDVTQCPNCGAPRPFISNVCPHCQHVYFYSKENEQSIQNMVDESNLLLNTMRNEIKKVTAGAIIKTRAIQFGLAIVSLPLLFIGGAAWIVALMFIFGMIKTPVDKYIEQWNVAEARLKNILRKMDYLYSDHKEACELIRNNYNEINRIRKEKSPKKVMITFSIIMVLATALFVWSRYQNYLERPANATQTDESINDESTGDSLQSAEPKQDSIEKGGE